MPDRSGDEQKYEKMPVSIFFIISSRHCTYETFGERGYFNPPYTFSMAVESIVYDKIKEKYLLLVNEQVKAGAGERGSIYHGLYTPVLFFISNI